MSFRLSVLSPDPISLHVIRFKINLSTVLRRMHMICILWFDDEDNSVFFISPAYLPCLRRPNWNFTSHPDSESELKGTSHVRAGLNTRHSEISSLVFVPRVTPMPAHIQTSRTKPRHQPPDTFVGSSHRNHRRSAPSEIMTAATRQIPRR